MPYKYKEDRKRNLAEYYIKNKGDWKRRYNPVKDREFQKRVNGNVRLDVLIRYGGGNPPSCQCCGERHVEFLVIDHIEGGGTKHRKALGIPSGNPFYKWLKRNNFPKGYRVLCDNCNASLGRYGYCPHQKYD